jgi:hypothetical protein
MSKSKRTTKSARKSKGAKKSSKQRQPKLAGKPVETQPPQSDCPYRPGTLYGTLFVEGNKDYVTKGDLIKKVAELTGKSEKLVAFAYQVLKSKTHRSNKNRSTEIQEGDKIKLIAIRRG